MLKESYSIKGKHITKEDIKIMEWSLDFIKRAYKNRMNLEKGLKILDKALERQNKKVKAQA